jgi:hypothetical protein
MVDEDVPRIPRGRGVDLTRVQLVKIAFTALLLVLVIVLQRPCANATGKFVSGFENPDAAPAKQPIQKPDQIDVPGSSGVYVELKGLTPEEQAAAIEKARKEAAERSEKAAGSGSATGSGSAAP